MHPAEHRAIRELRVFARQLEHHWGRLAARMGGEPAALFDAGARDAATLGRELAAAGAERGVPTEPAAALTGRFARARPGAPDAMVERNQALRYALLDVQHCVTLLGYLAGLAATRGDEPLRELWATWQERLARHEAGVRTAVGTLAGRPDDAIAPADPSPRGRLGQRIASAAGALGEWVDAQAARRGG